MNETSWDVIEGDCLEVMRGMAAGSVDCVDCVDIDRIAEPLTCPPDGAAVPTKARQLSLLTCPVDHARLLVRKWHSRLPNTQKGPWQFAFRMVYDGITFAVALWHNPSARTLPSHWLELRRMAVAPDAPHCTASRFLSEMARWFRRTCPEREMMISYQDAEVHTGTIYRAAGWEIGRVQAARVRDRTGLRPSGRKYRTSQNGQAPDGATKVRWQKRIANWRHKPVRTSQQDADARQQLLITEPLEADL